MTDTTEALDPLAALNVTTPEETDSPLATDIPETTLPENLAELLRAAESETVADITPDAERDCVPDADAGEEVWMADESDGEPEIGDLVALDKTAKSEADTAVTGAEDDSGAALVEDATLLIGSALGVSDEDGTSAGTELDSIGAAELEGATTTSDEEGDGVGTVKQVRS